jgi:hypothetical protein
VRVMSALSKAVGAALILTGVCGGCLLNAPSAHADPVTWVHDGALAFAVNCASVYNGSAMVSMWVQNVGSVPATYSTRNQLLRDDRGRIFAPDHGLKNSGGTPWDNTADGTWSGQLNLNPGTSATEVMVVFEVPPNDASQDHYQFMARESGSSSGTAVALAAVGCEPIGQLPPGGIR